MFCTPKLFKFDARGKTRVWFAEWRTSPTPGWRVHSGLLDGKITASGWRDCKPKNVGRANATTAEEQSRLEAFAKFERQKDNGYCEDLRSYTPPPKPMLAQTYKSQNIDGWLVSPKLDGIRALYRDGKLYTRTGKEHGPALEHIRVALEREMADSPGGLVIDGEIYIHDSEGCNFNELSGVIRKQNLTEDDKDKAQKLKFYMYDMYDPAKPELSFVNRLQWLLDMWTVFPDCIDLVECERGDVNELHDKYVSEGFEGAMIRDPHSPYENKRSKYLLKHKAFTDSEFPVIRVEEGSGNWAGFAKRIIVDVDGKPVGCGIRGTQQEMKELLERCDREGVPEECTVRFFGKTVDKSLRFPVVTSIHWGGRND